MKKLKCILFVDDNPADNRYHQIIVEEMKIADELQFVENLISSKNLNPMEKKLNCILLIDDNDADNVFHKIRITKADVCNVIKVVTSAQEALDYLKMAGELNQTENYPKPELIFLDINMPGMNGFEFLEEYKNLAPALKAKIVIVILSTSANASDIQKSQEINEVFDFETKPLSKESIENILEHYF